MSVISFSVFVMLFNKLIKINWITVKPVIDITSCWLRKWIAVSVWIRVYILENIRFVTMVIMVINFIVINYCINIDRYQY